MRVSLTAAARVAVCIVLVGTLVYVNGADAARRQSIADPARLQVIGGVIRKTGGDWRVHDNGTHSFLGVSAVTCQSSGVLVLTLDPVGAETGWGVIVPDERLAALDVTAGVSASKHELRVHTFRGDTSPGHRRPLSCRSPLFDTPSSNLWLSWTQTLEGVELP